MTKEKIEELMAKSHFVPHPAIKGGHAQTIISSLIPRRVKLIYERMEPRVFDVAPGVQVLALCSWQDDRTSRPTLLAVHGLEGSAESPYMLGIAEKAVAAGFNAIRLNLRSCGGTEHLTSALYHAGLTDDLRQIINELTGRDGLSRIYLAGFSLGGNIVLKLAGEYGAEIPAAARGVVAISPSIHLASCADAIELRSNFLYHLRFLKSLRNSMRRKATLFPDSYDASRLRGIRSIRQFDNTYTAPLSGFRDVADYYERASALPFISHIAIPTLIIYAKDDPFIPYPQFERREVVTNPNVTLLASDHGGHVGFISARAEGDDRYWAESRALDFIRLLDGTCRE